MKTTPSRIILRVPNWLGDTFMATPAVKRARELNPGAHLAVLCRSSFRDFWKAFPGVDGTVVLRPGKFLDNIRRLRAGKYDLALTLPLSFSSAFLFFAARIPQRAGYAAEGRGPFLTHSIPHGRARRKHLVAEYLWLVEKAFGAPAKTGPVSLGAPLAAGNTEAGALLRRHFLKGGLIALGPGATYGPAKRWPLAYWKEVMEGLLGTGNEKLLILGGREEADYLRPLAEAFPGGRVRLLAGETSVTGLTSLLSRCRLFITNDTGPMHAAAAAGTPTVAIFGSTSPRWTRPFGRGHVVLYGKTDCSPCFQRTCPIGYRCLHRVTPAQVLRAARRVLSVGQRVAPEAAK